MMYASRTQRLAARSAESSTAKRSFGPATAAAAAGVAPAPAPVVAGIAAAVVVASEWVSAADDVGAAASAVPAAGPSAFEDDSADIPDGGHSHGSKTAPHHARAGRRNNCVNKMLRE